VDQRSDLTVCPSRWRFDAWSRSYRGANVCRLHAAEAQPGHLGELAVGFLQPLFKAAGLKWLLFKGSSQSPDGDDRIEAKLNRLLEEQGIDPKTVTAAYLAPKTITSSGAFKGDGG
jgi:hypothetical protein